MKSQSLFYWNPFCNGTQTVPLGSGRVSQSLFYWNPFCNEEQEAGLCESEWGRNPYFIGILSAIWYSELKEENI